MNKTKEVKSENMDANNRQCPKIFFLKGKLIPSEKKVLIWEEKINSIQIIVKKAGHKAMRGKVQRILHQIGK